MLALLKTFPSAQALGGHQNAHRKERDEERRLYLKERLALLGQAPMTTTPPKDTAQNLGHFSILRTKPLSSHGRTQSKAGLGPLSIGSQRAQVQVFVPGLEYGPSTIESEVGYEVPYRPVSNGDQYYHPYEKPVYMNLTPWKLNLHEGRAFWGKDEPDGAWFRHASGAIGADSNARNFNKGGDSAEVTSKEELDLTLKL